MGSSLTLQQTLFFSSQYPTDLDTMGNAIASFNDRPNLILVYTRTIIETCLLLALKEKSKLEYMQ